MILPFLFIAFAKEKGRGVFTSEDIAAKTIIEIAPVIVLEEKDRLLVDQTLLHDYIFEWEVALRQCCMALGYVSIYNHAYASNCEYEMDINHQLITITTTRNIEKNEELFINYNGGWNDTKKVWFDVC
jgi:uncharacterized protein